MASQFERSVEHGGGLAPAAVLPNLLTARAASDPDHVLIETVEGQQVTHAELLDRAGRWAALLEGLGVGTDDAVVVMQPTSVDAYAIWLGIAVLGAIEIPVNTELKGGLLGYVLEDAGARVIVSSRRYLDVLGDQADRSATVETLVVSDAATADLPSTDERPRLLDGPAALAGLEPMPGRTDVQPWDVATVLYTSGTTGPSKGVIVPWGQIHATTLGSGPERTVRRPHTVFYSPYPTFHVSGKTPLYSVVLGGGRLVLRERFSAGNFWKDIREHGCTYASLVGSTANVIFKQPERDDDADNPLEAILFSPWTAEVEAFRHRFAVEAYSVFNMTEASCPIVGGWDGGPIDDPRSCGRPREGYELRIVDEHDREVGPGEPGELLIRAETPWTLMAGYWRKPEKTVEAWRNQWLHTGDMFTRDATGKFFYVDRIKDAIRRRGENISSAEVEAEVVAHPAVAEAAAIAIPDVDSGEEVKVVVRLVDGETLEPTELHRFLSDNLPRFMVPRYLEFTDELPKTPTAKVRKAELRRQGLTPATWDRLGSEAGSVVSG